MAARAAVIGELLRHDVDASQSFAQRLDQEALRLRGEGQEELAEAVAALAEESRNG
jgi:hypothetical protein